jgi:cobalt/nickel transport system permease protein
MHIPDGFIDPKISLGLLGAAVAVVGFAFTKVKEAVTALAPQEAFAAVGNGVKSIAGRGRRVLSSLGYKMIMVGILVFIAQFFDFPVISGNSGHLVGGVFVVVILGPFAGMLTMSSVLMIQAFFLADGGMVALGVNIINIAFIGSMLSYYIYAWFKKYIPEWLSIGITSWVSVMLITLAITLEGIPQLFKVYAIVGIAEALVTIAVVKIFRRLVKVS